MGSGEQGVSICFTTLPSLGRQVRDTRRDCPAHGPHETIRASPFRAKARLFAPSMLPSVHAVAWPRQLAMFIRQPRRLDHVLLRKSKERAASSSAVRASSSPQRLTLPWISVSPGELFQHCRQDRRKRPDQRRHVSVGVGQFAHVLGEGCSRRCAKLDAGLLKEPPPRKGGGVSRSAVSSPHFSS